MKTQLSFASLALACCLAVMAAGQRAKQARVHVLEPGAWHGVDVSARSGESWLGLYVTAEGSELRESKLTIKRVQDPLSDIGTTHRTGKRVGVGEALAPVFLVKGAGYLQPGLATTVFLKPPKRHFSLAEHTDVTLKLGAETYRLFVTGNGSSGTGVPLPLDAALYLSNGKTRQKLYAIEGINNDAGWTLLWAGDLDGDGKLDLYADLSFHYDISERRLFLSSRAKPGQLVAEVGQFRTSGC